MSTINVSPSRLKVFIDCPWAYYAKYILKLPDEGKAKTRLGSCIHELLELVATPIKQEWRKKFVLHSIRSKALHPTILRTFGKLLKKHDIPEDLHELGEKLVLDTFTNGYNTNVTVLDVEKEFLIQVSENVFLKGFIDKVCEINSNTIELTDYKSGAPFSYDKCQEEYQPYFYIAAARKLYPQYKNIVFNFHFLKNRKIVSVPKTTKQVEDFIKFVIAQGIEMLKIEEKSAICITGWKCKQFCAFKDPNLENNYSGCPAFFNKDGKSIYKQ